MNHDAEQTFDDDLALIRKAAREAGDIALGYFGRSPEVWWKNEGRSPVSAADYAANKDSWTADSEPVQKIAKLTGADPKDVPELLAGSAFPDAKQQAELLSGKTARDIAATAVFLKEQGKADSVLSDYSPYVSDAYIQ